MRLIRQHTKEASYLFVFSGGNMFSVSKVILNTGTYYLVYMYEKVTAKVQSV